MQPDAMSVEGSQTRTEDMEHEHLPGAAGEPPSACASVAMTQSLNPSGSIAETAADVPPPLVRIIEAICFVEGKPVTARRATELIPELTGEQFHQAVAELQRRYREQGRPYGFVRQGEGYLLAIRPQYRFLIDRLYGEKKEAVLSLAAIEVLAIIAYRQPVSRSTIEALRGRDSSAALRQLLRRGLIAVQSLEDKPAAAPTATAGNSPTPASESAPSSVQNASATDCHRVQPNSASSASLAVGQTTTDTSKPASTSETVQTESRAAQTAPTSSKSRGEQYYVTTRRFLEVFGLRDLTDLPRTDDLEIL